MYLMAAKFFASDVGVHIERRQIVADKSANIDGDRAMATYGGKFIK